MLGPSPASSTVIREFVGPEATELAIHHRPERGTADTARRVEAAYRGLAEMLAVHDGSLRELTCETLFVRDVRDVPGVLDARARVLASIGQGAWAPAPAVIQQAPVDTDVRFELAAAAVVPRRRDAWSVLDLPAASTCACDGCARSAARLVRLGEQRSLHTTNVYGVGEDPYRQAWDMFCAAERLLRQFDMSFRDVVRTWIHLRDIDRDYDAMNRARRAFFQDRGIERRPASTGVQGIPFPAAHDFSISVQAVQSSRPLDATVMSCPSLNEAWSYGADFSRGLRLVESNKVVLHVSGTASVDENGRTAHVGDLEGQVHRMLDNVASLLERHGATYDDLVSGVVYVKHAEDAGIVRSMLHEHGFDRCPYALVEAALCRADLLCEAEAVAMLPPAPKEA